MGSIGVRAMTRRRTNPGRAPGWTGLFLTASTLALAHAGHSHAQGAVQRYGDRTTRQSSDAQWYSRIVKGMIDEPSLSDSQKETPIYNPQNRVQFENSQPIATPSANVRLAVERLFFAIDLLYRFDAENKEFYPVSASEYLARVESSMAGKGAQQKPDELRQRLRFIGSLHQLFQPYAHGELPHRKGLNPQEKAFYRALEALWKVRNAATTMLDSPPGPKKLAQAKDLINAAFETCKHGVSDIGSQHEPSSLIPRFLSEGTPEWCLLKRELILCKMFGDYWPLHQRKKIRLYPELSPIDPDEKIPTLAGRLRVDFAINTIGSQRKAMIRSLAGLCEDHVFSQPEFVKTTDNDVVTTANRRLVTVRKSTTKLLKQIEILKTKALKYDPFGCGWEHQLLWDIENLLSSKDSSARTWRNWLTRYDECESWNVEWRWIIEYFLWATPSMLPDSASLVTVQQGLKQAYTRPSKNIIGSIALRRLRNRDLSTYSTREQFNGLWKEVHKIPHLFSESVAFRELEEKVFTKELNTIRPSNLAWISEYDKRIDRVEEQTNRSRIAELNHEAALWSLENNIDFDTALTRWDVARLWDKLSGQDQHDWYRAIWSFAQRDPSSDETIKALASVEKTILARRGEGTAELKKKFAQTCGMVLLNRLAAGKDVGDELFAGEVAFTIEQTRSVLNDALTKLERYWKRDSDGRRRSKRSKSHWDNVNNALVQLLNHYPHAAGKLARLYRVLAEHRLNGMKHGDGGGRFYATGDRVRLFCDKKYRMLSEKSLRDQADGEVRKILRESYQLVALACEQSISKRRDFERLRYSACKEDADCRNIVAAAIGRAASRDVNYHRRGTNKELWDSLFDDFTSGSQEELIFKKKVKKFLRLGGPAEFQDLYRFVEAEGLTVPGKQVRDVARRALEKRGNEASEDFWNSLWAWCRSEANTDRTTDTIFLRDAMLAAMRSKNCADAVTVGELFGWIANRRWLHARDWEELFEYLGDCAQESNRQATLDDEVVKLATTLMESKNSLRTCGEIRDQTWKRVAKAFYRRRLPESQALRLRVYRSAGKQLGDDAFKDYLSSTINGSSMDDLRGLSRALCAEGRLKNKGETNGIALKYFNLLSQHADNINQILGDGPEFANSLPDWALHDCLDSMVKMRRFRSLTPETQEAIRDIIKTTRWRIRESGIRDFKCLASWMRASPVAEENERMTGSSFEIAVRRAREIAELSGAILSQCSEGSACDDAFREQLERCPTLTSGTDYWHMLDKMMEDGIAKDGEIEDFREETSESIKAELAAAYVTFSTKMNAKVQPHRILGAADFSEGPPLEWDDQRKVHWWPLAAPSLRGVKKKVESANLEEPFARLTRLSYDRYVIARNVDSELRAICDTLESDSPHRVFILLMAATLAKSSDDDRDLRRKYLTEAVNSIEHLHRPEYALALKMILRESNRR